MTTTFDHGFTEEQVALKESALEFTKREVTPYLDQWEKDGEIPREFQKKLAHAGFLGVGVPEEVGGDGGTLLDICALQQGFMEAGWSGGLMASASPRRSVATAARCSTSARCSRASWRPAGRVA